jgi:hypothetical protein
LSLASSSFDAVVLEGRSHVVPVVPGPHLHCVHAGGLILFYVLPDFW